MRKLIRAFTRASRDSDVWPVVLLSFAVLVPAGCLLWFMSAAMRNERLAAQQALADAFRARLYSSKAQLEQNWATTIADLERLSQTTPPSAAFARCVQSGLVESVIILDGRQTVLYPDTPLAPLALPDDEKPNESSERSLDSKWAEGSRLEYLQKDFVGAAKRYEALAKGAENIHGAARALQAQARCLVQAGQPADAIRIVNEILGEERFSSAVDRQGRLIVANAELMALELLRDPEAPAFHAIARRLQRRLSDYTIPALAASQRRFLMKELQRLAPEIEFPTLNAEELAAEALSAMPLLIEEASRNLDRAGAPGLWRFTTSDRRLLALVHSSQLVARMRAVLTPAPQQPDADSEITLLPPEVDHTTAFVTLPAGDHLPGWRLAISLKDRNHLEVTTKQQAAIYLWTGVVVLAGMGVLALLAVRLLRRQVALARLKNDLAATVSHELKTPLSSMRVLVDTLLESEKFDEQKARDYLKLIARENDRLSRLIQNFLTFSRMERGKQAFDCIPVPPRQIVDAAVDSVRERFASPGCCLEVEVDENLPDIMADPDSLTAALINLLDNAFKYSGDIKRIRVNVGLRNALVVFSVHDNGIGIASRDTRKIFQPFHQLDQRLSRKGSGCGLGLSIVRYITNAHGGSVSVESQPGSGSTFRLTLPAALNAAPAGKEALV